MDVEMCVQQGVVVVLIFFTSVADVFSVHLTEFGSIYDHSSNEHSLVRDLLVEYFPQGRPVRDPNTSITVTVSFSLQQIGNLDERTQVLDTRGWLEVSWKDELLTWNVSKYNGAKRVAMWPSDVWIPDLAVANSVAQVFQGSYRYIRLTVNSNGQVYWWPGGIFQTACKVEIFFYPFDNQKCSIIIMGWNYFESEVFLKNGSSVVTLNEYTVNGQWNLYHTTSWRYSRVYPQGRTPEIYFDLYISRKISFVLVNILLPCVMISLLDLMVFYLDPESGEKISLGTTVLLAFTIFLLLIAEIVPKTADSIPIISISVSIFVAIYLMSLMIMTTMSVVLSVFVLRVHYTVPETASLTVPVLICKFIIVVIAPLVFCSRQRAQRYKTRIEPQTTRGSSWMRKLIERSLLKTVATPVLPRQHKRQVKLQDEEEDDDENTVTENCANNSHEMARLSTLPPRCSIYTSSGEEINFKFAALVCDRFMLYLFFMINTIVGLLLLLILPMNQMPHDPTYEPMFPASLTEANDTDHVHKHTLNLSS